MFSVKESQDNAAEKSVGLMSSIVKTANRISASFHYSTTMNTSQKRIAFILIAAALFAMAGTSCNTLRGVGRDVRSVGNGIERVAN